MTSGIVVDGTDFGRFWHCFGTERHRADLPTVVALLDASETKVLPINTHRLGGSLDRGALEHGFAGVTYDALAEQRDVSAHVKMLNINLRTSTDAAVIAAKRAFEMTGEKVLKLEVLDENLRHSTDALVLDAAEILMSWEPSLVVLPLVSNNSETAMRAVEIGCPILRVMGSPISSRNGIVDKDTFARIVAYGAPVVLDGGIGTTEHIHEAAELGAQGVLVNSVLFDSEAGPVSVMSQMRAAADEAFASGR
jgi:thiazole synthase